MAVVSGYIFIGLLKNGSFIDRYSFTVFQTAWFGDSPQKISEQDNTPGATRTFTGVTSVGTYTFVEKAGGLRETYANDLPR